MPGHGRAKDGVGSARLCPGHPRLMTAAARKTWMAGTSPAMTEKRSKSLFVSGVGNHAAGHQPVPDEQHHQRADRGGDETGALVRAVMADQLTDEGGEKHADKAEDHRQDKYARI